MTEIIQYRVIRYRAPCWNPPWLRGTNLAQPPVTGPFDPMSKGCGLWPSFWLSCSTLVSLRCPAASSESMSSS